MLHLLSVIVMGVLVLGQQPKAVVTQQDLPPPGAKAGKSEPAPDLKKETKKAPAEAPQPAQAKAPAAPKKKAAKPASPKETKAPATVAGDMTASPHRVAAFWMILPGK
jgi:hypothetical protein